MLFLYKNKQRNSPRQNRGIFNCREEFTKFNTYHLAGSRIRVNHVHASFAWESVENTSPPPQQKDLFGRIHDTFRPTLRKSEQKTKNKK